MLTEWRRSKTDYSAVATETEDNGISSSHAPSSIGSPDTNTFTEKYMGTCGAGHQRARLMIQ